MVVLLLLKDLWSRGAVASFQEKSETCERISSSILAAIFRSVMCARAKMQDIYVTYSKSCQALGVSATVMK